MTEEERRAEEILDEDEKKRKKRGLLGRLLVDNPVTQLGAAAFDTAASALRGTVETGEAARNLTADTLEKLGMSPLPEEARHLVSGRMRDVQERVDEVVEPEDPGARFLRGGARVVDTGLLYLLGARGGSAPLRLAKGGALDASIPADETSVRFLKDMGVPVPDAITESDVLSKGSEVLLGGGIGTAIETLARGGRGVAKAVEDTRANEILQQSDQRIDDQINFLDSLHNQVDEAAEATVRGEAPDLSHLKKEADELGIDAPDVDALTSARTKILRGGDPKMPRSWDEYKAYFRGVYQDVFDKDFPVAEAAKNADLLPSKNPYNTARTMYGSNAHATNVRRFGVVKPNTVEYRSMGLDEITKMAKNPQKFDEFLTGMRALEYKNLGGFTKAEVKALIKSGAQDPNIRAAEQELRKFTRESVKLLEEEGVLQKGAVDEILGPNPERAIAPGKGSELGKLYRELADEGILTKDDLKRLSEGATNEFYVPFFRVDSRIQSEFGKAVGNRKALKVRLPSSRGAIYSPLESLVQQTYAFSDLMFRTRLMRSLQELGQTPSGKGLFDDMGEATEDAMSALSGADDNARLGGILPEEVIEKLGSDSRGGFLAFSDRQGNAVLKLKNPEGKFHLYRTSKEILDALTVRAPHEYTFFQKMMIAPARWLRFGTTSMPDFMASNRFRDFILGQVTRKPSLSKSAYEGVPEAQEAITNTYHGIASLISDAANRGFEAVGSANRVDRTSLIRLWENSGGAFGELTSMDRAELRKMFEYMTSGGSMLSRRGVGKILHQAREVMTTPGRISENVERMNEFKRVYKTELAAGRSAEDAAVSAGAASRDITVDFARRGLVFDQGNSRMIMGRSGEYLRLADAFYNAALQGHSKLWRTLLDKNPNIRKKAWGTATGLITVPAVTNYMLNRDNDDYWSRPGYERRMFFLVQLPGMSHIPDAFKADDTPGLQGFISNLYKPMAEGPGGTVFLRVPIAHELGILFGTGPVSMMEAVDPKNPYASEPLTELEDVFGDIIGSQLYGLIPIPQVTELGMENLSNKSFYRGFQDIQSSHELAQPGLPDVKGEASALPEAISTALTHPPFGGGVGDMPQAIGNLFTPPKIQHTMEGMTGGLGRLALDITDDVLRDVDLEGPEPAGVLAERPIIDRFLSDFRPGATEESSRFWGELEKMERAERSAREYREGQPRARSEGLEARAQKTQLSAYDYARYEVLRDIATEISDLSKEIRQIEGANNPEYLEQFRGSTGSEQKRNRMFQLGEVMHDYLKLGTYDQEARKRLSDRLEGEDRWTGQEQEWRDRLDEADEEREQAEKDRRRYSIGLGPVQLRERVDIARIIDGDTAVLADSTHVRLRNHFAPEMSEPGGPEAKQAFESLMVGQRPYVDIGSRSRDPYGRLIADLDVGGALGLMTESASETLRRRVEQGGRGQ